MANKPTFLLLSSVLILGTVSSNKIIESPRETDWGVWGVWERCPFGTYVQGIQLRTEPYQGLFIDDTAANAIRLYCGDPANINTYYITSTQGPWGNWGRVYSCRSDDRPLPPDGYITGFQLRVEATESGDSTATNNIRVTCSYNQTSSQTKEADGLTFGSWTASRSCDTNQRICAFQTQVEPDQGDGDDTALNNIAAECCNF